MWSVNVSYARVLVIQREISMKCSPLVCLSENNNLHHLRENSTNPDLHHPQPVLAVVRHCISRHFTFTRLWSAQFIILLCVLLWYCNCLLPIFNAYSHRAMILWLRNSWRMLSACTRFLFTTWEDWQASENISQHLWLKDHLGFVSARSRVHLYVYCCIYFVLWCVVTLCCVFICRVKY